MTQVPEPIRTEILFQHEVLRAMLGNVVGTAQRLLRGEAAAYELRDAQRTLHDILQIHVRQEESALARFATPAPVSRHLHDSHERSLSALERISRHDAEASAKASVRLARGLLRRIDEEESALLGRRRVS